MTLMLALFCAIGGFLTGVLSTCAVLAWSVKRAIQELDEQQAPDDRHPL